MPQTTYRPSIRARLGLLLVFTICLQSVCSTLQAATEAYFTEPVSNNTVARDTVIGFINSAQNTLDVAIYTFTYGRSGSNLNQIALALQQARQRGVILRIVTDVDEVSNPSDTQFIILDTLDGSRNNILDPAVVRSGNAGGIMHNKFIIADGNRVLTGSTNWTSSAFLDQENNVLILEGSDPASLYQSEFNQMWGGTFGNNQPKPVRLFTTSDGVPGEVWFGADENITSVLTGAINAATQNIYCGINVFSSGAKAGLIASALKSAANRGVDVRVVMDSAVDQWDSLNGYPGIATHDYFAASILHSKYMIIDAGYPTARVLTGSNNWSNAADDDNDENLVILKTSDFAMKYYNNWRRLFVEKSSPVAGGSTPPYVFGDLTGNNQITVADYDEAVLIASGQKTATPLQIITGDVQPVPGTDGREFGDGVINGQEVIFLAGLLGIPLGTDSIGQMQAWQDGTQVYSLSYIVTASFGNTFYMQQPDRAAGIRVQFTSPTPVGTRVTVKGTMATLSSGNGERFISATEVTTDATNQPQPVPLLMNNRLVGGGAKNSYTKGISNQTDTYNIGMRVSTWGKVTAWSSLSFYVDDGSGISDGSGNIGVKVNSGSFTRPAVGSNVRVTGISSMEQRSGKNVRLLRPVTQGDIVILD